MNVILNLGCGNRPMKGAINHDRAPHSPHVDVAWDLNAVPWVWADEVFDKVIAEDVMEHLKLDVDVWLGQCWRILKPNGLLVLRLPAWDNPVSWRDPTHQRVFTEESMDYFDHRTELWRNYGQYYWDNYASWWHVLTRERVNGGDLGFVLRKVTSE